MCMHITTQAFNNKELRDRQTFHGLRMDDMTSHLEQTTEERIATKKHYRSVCAAVTVSKANTVTML